MLKVNENLSMREAISEALQKLPCDHECIEYVLRYLERRWFGERGPEENIGETNGFAKENNAIEHNLRLVLSNSSQTMQVLADQYGLDMRSVAPSTFGISLATSLGLKSICPQLQSSQQELTDMRSSNHILLQLLSDARAKLGCQ